MKRNKIINLKLIAPIFLCLSIFLLAIGKNVLAVDKPDLKYSVRTILPENQMDKNASYFSLKMKPEQKQEISIAVHNSGTEPIELVVEPHNAATNSNGIIIYNEDREVDESMKIPFTSVISEKQEVEIAPGKDEIISFELEMPKESYDGMILGGLRVYEKEEENKEQEKGLQINNKIEYEISVKLVETDVEVEPNLNLIDAKAGLNNYRTTIFAELQNDQAEVIDHLTVDAKIYKKNNDKPLFLRKKEEMRMAPNSTMSFPIELDQKSLKSGKYVLKVHAETEEQSWDLEKEFKISQEDAKKYNEEAVNIDERDYVKVFFYILIGLAVAILVVLLMLLIVSKNKKDKK